MSKNEKGTENAQGKSKGGWAIQGRETQNERRERRQRLAAATSRLRNTARLRAVSQKLLVTKSRNRQRCARHPRSCHAVLRPDSPIYNSLSPFSRLETPPPFSTVSLFDPPLLLPCYPDRKFLSQTLRTPAMLRVELTNGRQPDSRQMHREFLLPQD